MGRSSRTVHALAVILQYIRKKVQKHMLGREAGLLGRLIHHISSPHPRGCSAIGSSPRPQRNQDIFPHCLPSFLWSVKSAQENSLFLSFWTRWQGEEIDLIWVDLGFICF